MMKNLSKKGLTLVELLIVIVIIGLLATAFGVGVSKWRARTRDSQRTSDIRTIQQGLAFYFHRSEQSGFYPLCNTYINGSTDCLSDALKSAGVTSVIPSDPLSDTYDYYYCSYEFDGSCSFSSGTGETDGTSYILKFYLETSNVPGKAREWNIVTP